MPLVAKDEGFVYFQVAFVKGLTIVGATKCHQKGTLVKRKNCDLSQYRILLIYVFVEKGKWIDFL